MLNRRAGITVFVVALHLCLIPAAPAQPDPPPGAKVLFDGTIKSLKQNWQQQDGGGEPAWKIRPGGAMLATGGSIVTKEKFDEPLRLHVEFRTPDTEWRPLAPEGAPDGTPVAVSYHDERRGLVSWAPPFDMVAADSGRVFAKEVGRARFYLTMLEPMFRSFGNAAVPSMYFKLDPEQGDPEANDEDRLEHLDVPNSPHPAAVRFPLFRHSRTLDLNDSMIVHVDRRLRY